MGQNAAYFCRYPRTEPKETAQRRAFEGKQIPDQTPGGVTRPPPPCPRPALRGGVQGPRGPCDPRLLSSTFFDRAFCGASGRLGFRVGFPPWCAHEALPAMGWGINPAERLRRQGGALTGRTAREQRRAAPQWERPLQVDGFNLRTGFSELPSERIGAQPYYLVTCEVMARFHASLLPVSRSFHRCRPLL